MQFVIYAHHGIFDCIDFNNYENSIDRKKRDFLKKYGEVYENAKENFLCMYRLEELQILYSDAVKEYNLFSEKMNYIKESRVLDSTKSRNLTQLYFDFGFTAKMLLSTLIDSDWADSALFLR